MLTNYQQDNQPPDEMTLWEKTKLLKLVRDGNLQKTIDELLVVGGNKNFTKEVSVIVSRYNRLKQKVRLGILTFEQLNVVENQIAADLIDLINHSEDETYINKSIDKTEVKKPALRRYIITATIAIFILISLIISNIVPPKDNTKLAVSIIDKQGKVVMENINKPDNVLPKDKLKLIVLVTDEKGNVIMENMGKVNILLGKRPFDRYIDTNGIIELSDITLDDISDSIKIELNAKDWEIAGKNPIVFFTDDGTIEIRLKAKRNKIVIKGKVISKNSHEPIESAEVCINADTIVYTDSRGIFRAILPKKMRTDRYGLHITKEGYETEKQYYYLSSSEAEIRLKKKESKYPPPSDENSRRNKDNHKSNEIYDSEFGTKTVVDEDPEEVDSLSNNVKSSKNEVSKEPKKEKNK